MIRPPGDSRSLSSLGCLDQALDVVKPDLLVGPYLFKLPELGIVNEQVDFESPHPGKLQSFVNKCPQPSIFLDGFFADLAVLLLRRLHFNLFKKFIDLEQLLQ